MNTPFRSAGRERRSRPRAGIVVALVTTLWSGGTVGPVTEAGMACKTDATGPQCLSVGWEESAELCRTPDNTTCQLFLDPDHPNVGNMSILEVYLFKTASTAPNLLTSRVIRAEGTKALDPKAIVAQELHVDPEHIQREAAWFLLGRALPATESRALNFQPADGCFTVTAGHFTRQVRVQRCGTPASPADESVLGSRDLALFSLGTDAVVVVHYRAVEEKELETLDHEMLGMTFHAAVPGRTTGGQAAAPSQ